VDGFGGSCIFSDLDSFIDLYRSYDSINSSFAISKSTEMVRENAKYMMETAMGHSKEN
jgi:hypothetical protein